MDPFADFDTAPGLSQQPHSIMAPGATEAPAAYEMVTNKGVSKRSRGGLMEKSSSPPSHIQTHAYEHESRPDHKCCGFEIQNSDTQNRQGSSNQIRQLELYHTGAAVLKGRGSGGVG